MLPEQLTPYGHLLFLCDLNLVLVQYKVYISDN